MAGSALLVVAVISTGCVASGPETSTDEQNVFERNCPHQELEAVLLCDEPGGGELRFESHTGRYFLVERLVEEDLVGQKELNCRYESDPDSEWESAYVLDGRAETATSLGELQALVDRLPDLDEQERAVVQQNLAEPMSVIRYELSFWGRGDITYEGLSTGLESFRPSASPDNPAAAKVNFVIDETAYNAGFGGTYSTGTSCRLTLEPGE